MGDTPKSESGNAKSARLPPAVEPASTSNAPSTTTKLPIEPTTQRLPLVSDQTLEDWFHEGRLLLRGGKITDAHLVFSRITPHNPCFPNLGHALAVSLPNSLFVNVPMQITAANMWRLRAELFDRLNQYPQVELLLLDFSANRSLTSPGVEFLTAVQNFPHVIAKLVNVHPKPRRVLDVLRMEHLVWLPNSCPVCGPEGLCVAKFSKRRRMELLP